MTLRRLLAAAILLAASTAPASAAGTSPFGQPDRDYSAVSVIESGGQSVRQRIFYSPGSMRTEIAEGGAVLVLFDRQAVYMLMPGDMCMQMPMQQSARMTGAMMDDARTRRTEIGRETIDGRSTTRYSFEADFDGITSRGTTWISEEGLALRTEGTTMIDGAPQSFTMTLRDVRFERQDPALFQAPTGCMAMPGVPGGG